MWQEIEHRISEATGQAFRVQRRSEVGGGCINEAVRLEGDGRSFFVKLNRAGMLDMFAAEAAGLAAMAGTATVRVPAPVAWGESSGRCWLAMEHIQFGAEQAGTQARLGEQLAGMHRATTEAFGWDRDNTIGNTPQHNKRNRDWLSFLGEQRLGFQLELAADNGASGSLLDAGRRLLAQLPALFGGYRPQPSLLHGDLWGGNWAADSSGEPVVFDPATYYGDREADLAMTELFGGFGQDFYSAYEAAWPLDPGYRVRRRLYNLYHILNHYNLFGGGYERQAESLLDGLLAELE